MSSNPISENTKTSETAEDKALKDAEDNFEEVSRIAAEETGPDDASEEVPVEEPVAPKATPEPKQPSNADPVYGGTIPPWMQFGPSMMSFCRLTPMPLAPNEKHLPQEVELKGEFNELNRGNLEPDNFTISQKVQAIMTCKDGKWYIKDQSPYKTTFVLASEEVPLKNGDVILMGNRRFVFTEE